MMSKDMCGLGVALVTPFKQDGNVDYETLVQLVDYHIESGTDFLCVLGTTAETPTLTADEQRRVRETIVEHNAGRLPILLGVGGNCTQAVVERLAQDEMKGVDAILSVVPYYNKPTQAGIYAHFAAIARATELPIILYNVPGRTGVNMLPETTLRLAADFKNIVGIKEASGNLGQIERIIRESPKHFKVFSGDDGITLPLIKSGAAGVISVVGNAFASEFAQLVHSAQCGDYAIADAIDTRLRRMYELLFLDGNPAGVKSVMHQLGMMENKLRLPLVSASKTTEEQIREFLAAYKK